MQASRLLRQAVPIFRRAPIQRSYAYKDVFPPTTMNDLPVPKGSWKTNYDTNQKKYNRHLVLGVAFTAATLAFGQYFGYHEFYNEVPLNPPKIESYRD